MQYVTIRPTLLLFLALLLCGCVGHKKYTRILQEESAALTAAPAGAGDGWLSVALSDSLSTDLEVEKIHARFVPALLYWDWNSTLQCTLPAPLLAGWFTEGASAAADSLGITPDAVSVRLEELPGSFIFTDRGSVLILLVAYSTSELEGIIPGDAPLGLSFSIDDTEERALFATGLEPLANPGNSTRRFTREYLVSLRRAVRESAALWVQDWWAKK